MSKSNKTHPLIAREALMAGIAKMKEWKPEEQKTFTQKEAIEMLAEAARDQLAQGRSIGQVVIALRASIDLTIGDDTVRSYLRTAWAANDATAKKAPTTRRGRKAKLVTTETVPAKVDIVSAADSEFDDQTTGGVEESDSQQDDHGQDGVRQHDTTETEVDVQIDAVSDDGGDELGGIEALLGEHPVDADLDMEGRG